MYQSARRIKKTKCVGSQWRLFCRRKETDVLAKPCVYELVDCPGIRISFSYTEIVCVHFFRQCKFSLMHSRLGFKADFFFGICCYTPCCHSCPSLPKMYVGNIKARSPAFPASNTFLVPLMLTQIAPGWVMNIGYNVLVLLKNPPFISTRFC